MSSRSRTARPATHAADGMRMKGTKVSWPSATPTCQAARNATSAATPPQRPSQRPAQKAWTGTIRKLASERLSPSGAMAARHSATTTHVARGRVRAVASAPPTIVLPATAHAGAP